jgi:hypothetical protein
MRVAPSPQSIRINFGSSLASVSRYPRYPASLSIAAASIAAACRTSQHFAAVYGLIHRTNGPPSISYQLSCQAPKRKCARISHPDEARRGSNASRRPASLFADHPGTTGNFCSCKAANVSISSFRCAPSPVRAASASAADVLRRPVEPAAQSGHLPKHRRQPSARKRTQYLDARAVYRFSATTTKLSANHPGTLSLRHAL